MTNGRKSSNLVKSFELICYFIRLYLVPLPPYVKVNEEEVVFEDTIESGKVPESAFGLLKTYWNLAWFGGIHVLLQWKVPKGDPNFSPKLFLDNSELTVIKNSFSQAILEQLSVNLNKSKVEISTCFNKFSKYESTNIFHQMHNGRNGFYKRQFLSPNPGN